MERMDLEELKNLEHEELCALVEDGKISWSEFVLAQETEFPGYRDWCESNGVPENDKSALQFIDYIEESRGAGIPEHRLEVMDETFGSRKIMGDLQG